MNSVVSLEKISMGYQIYGSPLDIVKETILGGVRHETFWALKDIDLELKEGERLGIVGPNGAGKSTLLKIVCGNLVPTSGRALINGKISSLLSMTPAWNEEESGIENVKYNLLLQGVHRSKIADLTDEIIDFTELGPFIYQPVKTYSTGMGARLSFAIATATDPDILIVDEVLGTGDGYFAGKATARMKQFCSRGRALILVSHSTSAIQQMCNRVLWMESGAIRLLGDVEYVIKQYELDFRKAEDESIRAGNIEQANRRMHAASPEDIPEAPQVQRFRIVADGTTLFHASHYVRSIRVAVGKEPACQVALTASPRGDSEVAARIDSLGTEWGRIHERGGWTCRLLARATGRKIGGHLLVSTALGTGNEHPVTIELESASLVGSEQLAIEWLDLEQGKWVRLEKRGVCQLGGEWNRSTFAATVREFEGAARRAAIERVQHESLEDAEIVRVEAWQGSQESYLVKEKESFSIVVDTLFRRDLPGADVTLKINRSDGVHAYWTSCGEQGLKLDGSSGRRQIVFKFDKNYLGAGSYSASVHITSRFQYPDEWPYKQLYAKALDAIKFTVVPERPLVNKGVLNWAAEIMVIEKRESEKHEIEGMHAEG
jgi:lipopolysaccharide transport system ATP-binding protein